MIYFSKPFSDSLLALPAHPLYWHHCQTGSLHGVGNQVISSSQFAIAKKKKLFLSPSIPTPSWGRDWLVCLGSCVFHCTNHLQAIGIGYSDWPGLGYMPTPCWWEGLISVVFKTWKKLPKSILESYDFLNLKGRNARQMLQSTWWANVD